jgi:hypothetical protein
MSSATLDPWNALLARHGFTAGRAGHGSPPQPPSKERRVWHCACIAVGDIKAQGRHRSSAPHNHGCAMQVKNGPYTIRIEMRDGKRGHATGVIILSDGQIRGGDTYFYYTGSYSFRNGNGVVKLSRTSIPRPLVRTLHLEAGKSVAALREFILTERPKWKALHWLARPASCLVRF